MPSRAFRKKTIYQNAEPIAHVRVQSTAPYGLGDTLERVFSTLHLDKLATAYVKVTGKDCGCQKRKEKLNEAFPYKKDDNG